MTETLDTILVLIIFAGLIGTLFPSIPGIGIILGGAVIHGLLTDFTPLNWQYLLFLTLLCLAGYGGQYLITGASSKKMGASRYGVIGACLGMFVGFILPLPGGIFAGAFIGAVAFEIIFDLKDFQEAFKAGIGALAGTLFSLFFEFVVGLAMAMLIFYSLFNYRF